MSSSDTESHTDEYFEKVREDHVFHRFMHISVSIWAGYLWGWMWGIALFIVLFLIIALSNVAIGFATQSLKMIRFNRWFWILAAAALIVVASAKVVQV